MSDGGGGPLEPPPARQHRKMKRSICAHGVAHRVVVVAALGCLGCAVSEGSLVGWSMRTVRGARPDSRTNTSFTAKHLGCRWCASLECARRATDARDGRRGPVGLIH